MEGIEFTLSYDGHWYKVYADGVFWQKFSSLAQAMTAFPAVRYVLPDQFTDTDLAAYAQYTQNWDAGLDDARR